MLKSGSRECAAPRLLVLYGSMLFHSDSPSSGTVVASDAGPSSDPLSAAVVGSGAWIRANHVRETLSAEFSMVQNFSSRTFMRRRLAARARRTATRGGRSSTS